jgi:hypothetical protein
MSETANHEWDAWQVAWRNASAPPVQEWLASRSKP